MNIYLGVDVGSVTTKFALVSDEGELIAYNYLRTQGRPILAVQQGLQGIKGRLPLTGEIRGVCATGSARFLAGVALGADVVKNEITAHAVAALHYTPDVSTIVEIGGQDSKLIVVRDGMVVDFAMNTVCAAGTGSFLEQQALRLNIRIEDFGEMALQSKTPVRIDGRCTVFAESDMIHKQQMGHRTEDILYGLCQALVHNYLNSVGRGKVIQSPIVFQGGVAFNQGIVCAFKESLNTEVVVPRYHEAMGAIGAALLAREEMARCEKPTSFVGFEVGEMRSEYSSCRSCGEDTELFQTATRTCCQENHCDMCEGGNSAQSRI